MSDNKCYNNNYNIKFLNKPFISILLTYDPKSRENNKSFVTVRYFTKYQGKQGIN